MVYAAEMEAKNVTESVSKGVFLFKGKKASASAADYFGDESVDSREQNRISVYEDLWESVDEKLQVIQSGLNTRIFSELLTYIENAYCRSGLDGETSDATFLPEIPTAALITGVNTPDHSVMFSNLSTMLEEQVTPHVALLRSKDCSTVKQIMSKTLSQFMENADLVDEDEEELGGISVNKVSSTMSNLASWYHAISKKASSPRKKQKVGSSSARSNAPLVIILEDLESFQPQVLQDFITICSQHLSAIPLVLVFGIATAVTAVHQLLPHQVSCLLSMEKFQAPPSSQYLTSAIQNILLSPAVPLKLGSKVFNLLMDLFLYHDFSVQNFIRGFKFALMEHFLTSKVSILCQPLEESVNVVRYMKHSEVEDIRRLMSFRRHVEHCEPKTQIELLTEDRLAKKAIVAMLEEMESYHQHFFPVMHCLHHLVSNLPGYPLGKHVRELYSICLASSVTESEEYKHALALVKNMSRQELVVMIEQCRDQLSSENTSESLKEVGVTLESYIEKFSDLEELSKIHPDEEDGEEENEEYLPKKMNMYALRQKLEEMGKRKKKLTVYEVLRNEFVDKMDEVFKKYLKCPSSLALHEVFYFNNAATVKNHMIGMPRAVIQNALTTPHSYIQALGCESDAGAIPPTLPDLCIIYKLHLECGRLINLYDWLQAFITIVQADDDDESGEQKKPDRVLQARFIRAVSELQFLGFIKPTKRKTDHVARLTWGGC